MAKTKRKKYPRLPNGYGSIKYLGSGRRNPYGIYPPVEDYSNDGIPITPKALCYTDSWMKGFAVLTAYRAGTYYRGFELTLNLDDTGNLDELSQKILSDYQQTKKVISESPQDSGPTFEDVYKDFFVWKYDRKGAKNYSESTKYATRSGFLNCQPLHKKPFKEVSFDDLQKILDESTLRHAGQEHIVTFLHQLYAYAVPRDLTDKDYSSFLQIGIPDDDEHGIPFTNDELQILWKHKDNPTIEMILIMCYSGFRVAAYEMMEVNLSDWYFKGGVKTRYSKERVVPIHTGIRDLVKKRMRRDGILIQSSPRFREDMKAILPTLGIEIHTPHDCRHTFSKLCEEYKVNENDRKRMLGHSFGNDITNRVYGHRSLEDLRTEIEKICICYFLVANGSKMVC